MPGFDRTGPSGLGPLTGGGRGYCAPGYPAPVAGRTPWYSRFFRRAGRGGGRGTAMGTGRGRGGGRGFRRW
jgi:hypothetical protein